MCNNEEYRMLILSMSNVYSYRETTYNNRIDKEDSEIKNVIGYTQLEPIPYYLLQKGEPLNEILVLKTKEIENILADSIIQEIRKHREDLDDDKLKDFTAIDIWKENIKKHYSGNISFKEINNIDVYKLESITGGIKEAVEHIRGKWAKYGQGFKLYMDIHGGPREIQIILQAIISLLKVEGIEIEQTFTAQGGQQGSISSVDETVSIFDFVSGINEFINYGRADSLARFFDKKPENYEPFISAVQNIADDISICNMDKFEEHLDEFAYVKENYKNKSGYISIFIGNMEQDYGILLNPKERTVIDQIEWCIKKGFIQQALTLVESKMPEEIYQKMFFNVLGSEFDREKWESNEWKKDNKKYKCKDVIAKSKKSWENIYNVFVQTWCFQLLIDGYEKESFDDKSGRIKGNKLKDFIDITSDTFDIDEFNGMSIKIKDYEKKTSEDKPETFFIYYEESKNYYRIRICTKNSSPYLVYYKDDKAYIDKYGEDKALQDYKNALRFLKLHMSLKNERNKINHASNNSDEDRARASTERVINALRIYVDSYKNLPSIEDTIKNMDIDISNDDIKEEFRYYVQIVVYVLKNMTNSIASLREIQNYVNNHLPVSLPKKKELTKEGKLSGIKLIAKYCPNNISVTGEGLDAILKYTE